MSERGDASVEFVGVLVAVVIRLFAFWGVGGGVGMGSGPAR
ncbi:hypothetical protein [Actinomyces bouchesdurhonensis]|nr:hypothetical protein [Actinomyces bouchesdurhonensis]